ncbi:MAG: glycosyltransferase family 2 protein [Pseudomonadota bacterium]
MPSVSFLLPVYNGARYLAETLDSLFAQDYPDFDVLAVDDGSTDESPDILARYAEDYPRLRILTRPNGGLVEALNHGLSQLDCAFVARIDADDTCFPDRLSKQLDFMAFTGAVAVSSKSLHIDEVGNVLGVSGSYGIFNADPHWLPAIEPYLPHPFLLAQLDVLEEAGYRTAHLAEDADLCWRLAERWPIAMQGAVLGQYRIHTDSISTSSLTAARVQAFFSQLAALNTRRRMAGANEVAYDVDLATAMQAGESWDGLMALYADRISKSEAVQLRAGSVLKLLDLASWRGYRPTAGDITAAAHAVRQLREMSEENREEAMRLISGTAPADQAIPIRGFGDRLRGFLGRA